MSGRGQRKTQAMAQEIRLLAPGCDVRFLLADLASQAQVQALVQAYHATYPRLDALINNAGGMFARRQLSVDGAGDDLCAQLLRSIPAHPSAPPSPGRRLPAPT